MQDGRYFRHVYFNDGYHGIAIVAVVSVFNGEAYDWTAYIGAAGPEHEQDAVTETIEHGCKLNVYVAEAVFPDIYAEFGAMFYRP